MESRFALSASAGPHLVKDINTDPVSSKPDQFLAIGKHTYFTADDGIHGRELWRSDGTAKGTRLVLDVNPGLGSSNPQHLTRVGNSLFFVANDGTHWVQIWKTDGTAKGTIRVSRIKVDTIQPKSMGELADVNGELYFVYGTNDSELWKTDGTTGGTMRITKLDWAPISLTNVNGRLFFLTDDSEHGREIWTSNGSLQGTHIVKDIRPGRTSSVPQELTAFGNQLIFTADDGIHGREAWISDGTADGTKLIRDVNPSNKPNYQLRTHGFTDVNGTIFFQSDSQLWKSDGTEAGTELVKNFNGLANLERDMDGPVMANVNGTLYFLSYNYAEHRAQLWKSDGTATGTIYISSLIGSPSYSTVFPESLQLISGTLFLNVSSGYSISPDSWTSDGTADGTRRIADALGSPRKIIPTLAPGTLFFSRNDALHGTELWKTDGTAYGTKLVLDINTETYGISIPQLIGIDGKLMFATNSYYGGGQLWTSDGTQTGTNLVAGLTEPLKSPPVQSFTNANGRLFFTVDGSPPGYLWTSDGSEEGTVKLGYYFTLYELCAVGDTLFFVGQGNGLFNGVNRYVQGLWKTDGTRAGTTLVEAFNPNSSTYAAHLTNVNGMLYYTTQSDFGGVTSLWKTDGTPGNAVELAQMPTADGAAFGSIGNELYFVRPKWDSLGFELWRSDGTPAGTSIIKETTIPASDVRYRILQLITLDDTVYFTGDDQTHGVELWKTDGTPAGTKRITDGASPALLAGIGDRIYFNASNEKGQYRLWSSDGTAKGTHEIGPQANNIPVELDGKAYYTGYSSAYGYELWQTDGTKQGTKLAADINPGPQRSLPMNLVAVKGQLFFTADDGIHGTELWKFKPAASPPPKPLPLNTVLVNIVAGALTIQGDHAGNSISLHQVDSSDGRLHLKITGTGTKIADRKNGTIRSILAIDDVTSIYVSLGSGNDSFTIDHLQLSGPLSIDLGSGNDRLNLATVNVGIMPASASEVATLTSITVELGSGNDIASLTNLRMSGSMSVNAGTGRDVVAVTHAVLDSSNPGISLSVIMSSGNDDRLVVTDSKAATAIFHDDRDSRGVFVGLHNRFRKQTVSGFAIHGVGLVG